MKASYIKVEVPFFLKYFTNLSEFRTLISIMKKGEWHLFFDGLVPIKSIGYFERYFSTIVHISQTGHIPLCIYAIKWAFLLQILENAVFYFIPLNHNARVVLFDYAYLSNIGQDFAILA